MIAIHDNIHILEDATIKANSIDYIITSYQKLIENDSSPTDGEREQMMTLIDAILKHSNEIDKACTILHDVIEDAYERYQKEHPSPVAIYYVIDKNGNAQKTDATTYRKVTPRNVINENVELLDTSGNPIDELGNPIQQ